MLLLLIYQEFIGFFSVSLHGENGSVTLPEKTLILNQ